jgi:4-hydroxyphenylpyruvate dioxygenase-like putative hemolysin
VLPGVENVEAEFDSISLPAYCDHWVSNVVSRTGFIDTLNDTLGFAPKVDFNAGVVAAGEAQIESTVAGNDPGIFMEDEQTALESQSQVYLPINNALSEVGHVHLYLKEIGQGIQHIASRVSDLPAIIQRANDMRKATGAGLSFLSIPQSYYGFLRKDYMAKELKIDASLAEQYVAALREAKLLSPSDNVYLHVTREQVAAAIPSAGPDVVEHVMRARYSNLYALLRDNVGEETYLSIVRNQVLVDIQGGDLLMQIFTIPVLQREAGQEAPFFEFIQRVCSNKTDDSGKRLPMKPGCGGFGIRNFLTLFLSIEVSKASKQRSDAEQNGKHEAAAYYGRMVDAFTQQLEESNPVLTLISDAMTEEGEAIARGDTEAAERCKGAHFVELYHHHHTAKNLTAVRKRKVSNL